jgi:trk system potassium uptake protein
VGHNRGSLFRKVRPGVALLAGIILLIVVGAGCLSFPGAISTGSELGFIDAVFTSTSALCVTGLITKDTATDFTFLGQLMILILIQIGGLGVMSVAAMVSLMAGQGIGVTESRQLREMFQGEYLRESRQLIKFILLFTLIFESIGALFLYFGLGSEAFDIPQRIWFAVFHSVSAFCNAGFSTYSDSLVSLSDNTIFVNTVTSLLVVGGLGFAVVANLLAYLKGRALGNRKIRLSVQTKVVVSISIALLFIGAGLIYFCDVGNAFADKTLSESISMSVFQSATSRTAGFNTIDLNLLTTSSLFVIIILMFIGAAPGSTGGGIKITTVAVLWANARAIARGDSEARLYDRAVSNLVVRQALLVFAISSACAVTGLFLLSIFESHSFMVIAFETFSAIGTVGLSLGLTPDLSIPGKLVVLLLMLVGRVGPLAVAYGLVKASKTRGIKYPSGRFIVG